MIVIHTGIQGPDVDSLVYENSCGEEITGCVCMQVVQIPAWTVHAEYECAEVVHLVWVVFCQLINSLDRKVLLSLD